MASDTLTVAAVKAAKATEKPYKLFDGRGMYLLVKPNGTKLWRLKYRFGGSEKLLALGVYPEITLQRAREKRDDARKLLDRDLDPGVQRRAQRRAPKTSPNDSLGSVAEEWFAHYLEQKRQSQKPLAEATVEKTQWLLNLAAYQAKEGKADAAHPLKLLSPRPIRTITKGDVGQVMSDLKRRDKIETAHRLLDRLDKVFRYAVGTGRMDQNPAAAFRDSADPRDKLPPVNHEHHPAITEPRQVGELLRAIDGYRGEATTEAALKLSPYLFVRPVELRKARWRDFDLDGKEPVWRIPSKTAKQRLPHIVPLPKQAVAVLKDLYRLTGPDGLVFPLSKDPKRPMSENSVTSALRRMGYSGQVQTWHGFRTIASTLLREIGWEGELIERQLAHEIGSDTAQSYDRSTRLPERRKMMTAWADYLDGLKVCGNSVLGRN